VSAAGRDGSGTGSDAAADVRIVRGGRTTPAEQVAIVTAVTRIVREREVERATRPSAWALAGRLEASGATTVRARSGLPRG
jgi:hypothetical protein